MFSPRRITPELMDELDAPRDELDASLAFIRAVNHRLGGVRAVLAHLERWSTEWPTGETIRIIDIGTGSADVPLAIVRWAARRGRAVHVTAIDRHPTTLALAREHVGDRPEIELIEADAAALTDRFEPGDFDYAHAGMFLHHLSDIRVLTVLRMMDRLSRRGIIWNDLLRGVVSRLGVRVLTLGAPHMVRHDARVSIDAGFTRREALEIAARVGLERVRFRSHLGHRFTLVSEKSTVIG